MKHEKYQTPSKGAAALTGAAAAQDPREQSHDPREDRGVGAAGVGAAAPAGGSIISAGEQPLQSRERGPPVNCVVAGATTFASSSSAGFSSPDKGGVVSASGPTFSFGGAFSPMKGPELLKVPPTLERFRLAEKPLLNSAASEFATSSRGYDPLRMHPALEQINANIPRATNPGNELPVRTRDEIAQLDSWWSHGKIHDIIYIDFDMTLATAHMPREVDPVSWAATNFGEQSRIDYLKYSINWVRGQRNPPIQCYVLTLNSSDRVASALRTVGLLDVFAGILGNDAMPFSPNKGMRIKEHVGGICFNPGIIGTVQRTGVEGKVDIISSVREVTRVFRLKSARFRGAHVVPARHHDRRSHRRFCR